MTAEKEGGEGVALLRGLLLGTLLSTALHYTHNVVAIEQYPGADGSSDDLRVRIVVGWVVLTAIGLWGYRLYASGRHRRAHVAIAIYSLVGFGSLGHFPNGWPDIGAFWIGTIFTDAIMGVALLAFAIRSEWMLQSAVTHGARGSG